MLDEIPLAARAANPRLVRDGPGNSVFKEFAIKSVPSARRRREVPHSFARSLVSMPSLIRVASPAAFNSEFLLRDIRVNPVGRGFPVAEEAAPARAFGPPTLDLTLQLPKGSVAPETVASTASMPRPSPAGTEQTPARSTNSETRPAGGPQVLSVPEVADRVYRLLERRLVIERERRGVFRS
jgi:hypothetical protein